jgi:hypothetical protein
VLCLATIGHHSAYLCTVLLSDRFLLLASGPRMEKEAHRIYQSGCGKADCLLYFELMVRPQQR